MIFFLQKVGNWDKGYVNLLDYNSILPYYINKSCDVP